MVAHACNLITGEEEAGNWEFKASLDYIARYVSGKKENAI
jgi:hypothetical protein